MTNAQKAEQKRGLKWKQLTFCLGNAHIWLVVYIWDNLLLNQTISCGLVECVLVIDKGKHMWIKIENGMLEAMTANMTRIPTMEQGENVTFICSC